MNTARSKPSLWTVWHRTELSQHRRTKTDGEGDLKDEESVSYPDHSSLHDDQEGIFSGTLQSHDHMTLLADRHTCSHSRRRKYPGRILETRQSRTQHSTVIWEDGHQPLSILMKWLHDFISFFSLHPLTVIHHSGQLYFDWLYVCRSKEVRGFRLVFDCFFFFVFFLFFCCLLISLLSFYSNNTVEQNTTSSKC